MADLYQGYLAGATAARCWFPLAPEQVFARPPATRDWEPDLRDALRAYQDRLGIVRSFQGNEAVVVTGQQPGLFTGPLYTIYKAITAIRLAATIEERTGVRCLPIFWVGSEDHDFEEARSAHFLSKQHESLTVRYEPEADVTGLPMHRVPIEPSLHGLVDAAAHKTPGSEHRDPVAALLHETLDQADSLADWCARLLARLFSDTPLLIFSPHLFSARRAAVPVLAREIANPLASTRLLNERGAALADAGFDVQLQKHENACNFFLEVNRRRRVTFEDGHFAVPEETLRFSPMEMQALLQSEPARFSPNVALRCVVQQQLFPAAAYVAGPGEVGYWAQLAPLFSHFGLAMPVVYPRASCTLTTIKLNKLRAKFGFTIGDLLEPFDVLEDRGLRGAQDDPAAGVFQAHYEALLRPYAALQEAMAALPKRDPAAVEMSARLTSEIAARLDRFEQSLMRRQLDRVESVRRQLSRLCAALAPGRKPQERVYCAFSFLFEHGPELIGRLCRELDIHSFSMNEVEL